MKIRVIGAVAAGTSAATKAKRNDREAEIVIYEKDIHISYSGCSLPYYIGGEINDENVLVPRGTDFFKEKHDIDIKIRHEVLSIDRENKTLEVKNLESGVVFSDKYDKLIISTGAAPFVPPIKGVDLPHVFTLRNVRNGLEIRRFIEEKNPQKAMIAGTGFIGFELLENLMHRGIDTVMVEVMDKITPNLDIDMAEVLEEKLAEKGVKIKKSTGIKEILEKEVKLSTGEALACDLVILSTGVRPNVALAKSIGLKLGQTGAIKVDDRMRTSDENIFACGDCIETFDWITKKGVFRPLGSTANKTGRIVGEVITGGDIRYKGNLGTSIFKLFDLAIGTTGLSEKTALAEGYDIEIVKSEFEDRPPVMGGSKMTIKAIADKKNNKLLGVQIIGNYGNGVDKRIDVFATLLSYGATVDELFHLDLAYSPPFSTAKDPVHFTGMILESKLSK